MSMAVLWSALLGSAAAAVLTGAPSVGRRRLRSLARPTERAAPARLRRPGGLGAAAVVVLSACAVAGVVGALAAVAAVSGWFVVRRRSRRSPPLDPFSVALALDLLAACLTAGVPIAAAVRTTADAAPGDVGSSLLAVAAALERGVSAEDAWAPWVADPATRRAARALVRAAHSGAAPAGVVGVAAVRQREAARSRAQRRVQAAGTWSVLPLGLCFLPAFVLVGVVPLVVGLVGTLR